MMAFVKIIETSVDSNNTGGDVFTSPNGSWAGKSLPLNTDWNYFGTQTVNGKTWYDLGGDQWISEEYAAPNITKFEQRRGIAKVSNFTTATVYYSPNGNPNRVANPSPLPMNYEYAYNKAVTDSQGIIWLDVGRSQWVTTREVVDKNANVWMYPFEAPYNNANGVSHAQDFGWVRPGFHNGLDFGTANHPHKIIAVHSGTIVLAGDITPDEYIRKYVPGWGGTSMEMSIGKWVVILRTDEGHDVIYQEFAGGRADISVHEGQRVNTGDEIGYLNTGAFNGFATISHLHLGICTGTWVNAVQDGGSYRESTWVNPRSIL